MKRNNYDIAINDNKNNNLPSKIDQTDLDIISLLLQNYNNKEISANLKIPLSTIQRRVRNLVVNDFIKSKIELNYKKFGYKQGLVHIYLNNGNLEGIMEKLSLLKGIISIEVHIGNSDILTGIIYKEGSELECYFVY